MIACSPLRQPFLAGLFLLAAALLLGGCATRPKPVAPNSAITVSAITVTADRSEDRSFSGVLNDALYDRLGRATRDVGEDVTVSVTVLERGRYWTPVAIAREFRQYARVQVMVTSKESGKILADKTLRSVAASPREDAADTTLAGRIALDIRIMLGLTGSVPSPIDGDKRPAAKPAAKPQDTPKLIEDTPVINEAESADPLLNGKVVEINAPLRETKPVIDTSAPLLAPVTSEPEAAAKPEEPAKKEAALTVEPVSPSGIPQGLSLPAAPPPVPAPGASDLDAPCVITLENDCSS